MLSYVTLPMTELIRLILKENDYKSNIKVRANISNTSVNI